MRTLQLITVTACLAAFTQACKESAAPTPQNTVEVRGEAIRSIDEPAPAPAATTNVAATNAVAEKVAEKTAEPVTPPAKTGSTMIMGATPADVEDILKGWEARATSEPSGKRQTVEYTRDLQLTVTFAEGRATQVKVDDRPGEGMSPISQRRFVELLNLIGGGPPAPDNVTRDDSGIRSFRVDKQVQLTALPKSKTDPDPAKVAKAAAAALAPASTNAAGTTNTIVANATTNTTIFPVEMDGKHRVIGFDQLASFEFEVPEEEYDPDKQPDPENQPDQIPPTIKALDKKLVAIKGFMLPLKVEDGEITELLIMRDQSMCCYGTVPKINEWVSVKFIGKGVKPIMDQAVTVYGKLKVGEMRENGYLIGIYEMDGEKMTGPLDL